MQRTRDISDLQAPLPIITIKWAEDVVKSHRLDDRDLNILRNPSDLVTLAMFQERSFLDTLVEYVVRYMKSFRCMSVRIKPTTPIMIAELLLLVHARLTFRKQG